MQEKGKLASGLQVRRRSTTSAANMLTWRSEARLNATTWEQDAPFTASWVVATMNVVPALQISRPSAFVHPLDAYLDGCHVCYLRLDKATSPDS
ncbi:unnamed protein product [Urochloa humidicola]